MSHYGTQIIKVDLYDGKVLGYGGYNKTDSAYINHALNQMAQYYGLDNNFRCRRNRRLNKIWIRILRENFTIITCDYSIRTKF